MASRLSLQSDLGHDQFDCTNGLQTRCMRSYKHCSAFEVIIHDERMRSPRLVAARGQTGVFASALRLIAAAAAAANADCPQVCWPHVVGAFGPGLPMRASVSGHPASRLMHP